MFLAATRPLLGTETIAFVDRAASTFLVDEVKASVRCGRIDGFGRWPLAEILVLAFDEDVDNHHEFGNRVDRVEEKANPSPNSV